MAGGGTGGATVFSGEQFNHTNAEVIYLDFSITSMKIAQRRARTRHLKNIVWVRSWIEDARFLGMGLFNELSCSGVLHHLKSPPFGLNILKDVLKPDGKMGLMVYAKYGRSAVYHIQALMKMINSYGTSEIKRELDNAQHALAVLPKHNWFLLNEFMNDHKKGPIGIYDLLLHKRDVAYSFETLFKWINNGGLHFVDLDFYFQRYLIKPKYAFHDHMIKRTLSKLGLAKQLHASELLVGKLIKHTFYSSKTQNNLADVHDDSNVMYIFGSPHGLRDALNNKQNYIIYENEPYFVTRLSRRLIVQGDMDSKRMPFEDETQQNDGVKFGFRTNNFTKFLVNRLTSSNKGVNLKSLYSDYKKASNSNITKEGLSNLLDQFYNDVVDTEIFLLKKNYIPPFPKTAYCNFFKINPATM